ncbi:MAG TPA: sigma-70 family RNA polymerase sigma factor, partial [Dehalococcoidia bacterium]|nr:sigma-70 family RNA polymerase sigma factor [Dehalococcoidia bacterium]
RRQQTTAAGSPGDSEMDADETLARSQDQPEQKAEILATTETLFVLIEELPADQKQAFLLREEAGMNIQEIAEITGVNPETAKSRLRYAVNKLREGLREYEPG